MRVQVILGAVALAFGAFSGSAEACHGGFGKAFRGGCHKQAPVCATYVPAPAPCAVPAPAPCPPPVACAPAPCAAPAKKRCGLGFGNLFRGGCHKKQVVACPPPVVPCSAGVDVVGVPSYPAPVAYPEPVAYPAPQVPTAQSWASPQH